MLRFCRFLNRDKNYVGGGMEFKDKIINLLIGVTVHIAVVTYNFEENK